MKELSELERVNDEYNVELEQFKEMDPDLFEQKSRPLMNWPCFILIDWRI